MFIPTVKKLLSEEELSSFEQVKQELLTVPDVTLPSGNTISCHMVCRLVSRKTGLDFHDGYFGDMFQHSWLTLNDCIIDPYPVGVLEAPLLLHTGYLLPWKRMYKEGKLEVVGTQKFIRDMAFLEAASRLSEAQTLSSTQSK